MEYCDDCERKLLKLATVFVDVEKFKCPDCECIYFIKLFPWEIPSYVGLDGPFFNPRLYEMSM